MNEEPQSLLIPPTLGETLRAERERRGLSLPDLAAEIRVRPAILAAIESDDTAHIPRVYLKGYIRNYAQRLGVDPADVEGHIAAVPAAEPPVQPVFSERLPRDRSERWFKATSYVLASGLVLALVWQFTAEAVRFSQGESMPRVGAEDTTEEAERSGEPATTDRAGAAEPRQRSDAAKSHLRASIASMQPARISQQGRSVAEDAWAAVGNREAAGAPGDPPGPAISALTIATSADSWVEIIDATGQKIEMDLLRAGTRRRYDGEAPYRVLLGRASSIELTFRGEPVDLGPHTRGNVARVTLGAPPEAVPSSPATPPGTVDQEPSASPPASGGTSDQG